MTPEELEIKEFLLAHLRGIQNNDVESYYETSSPDLTLYEWWVTPQRIDGLPFHEFMMAANDQQGTVFGAAEEAMDGETQTRFDLANLKIQRYDDAAVASYTLMMSSALPEGVRVVTHNESRVIVKIDGAWKVVHVHKSPSWQAPHVGDSA